MISKVIRFIAKLFGVVASRTKTGGGGHQQHYGRGGRYGG